MINSHMGRPPPPPLEQNDISNISGFSQFTGTQAVQYRTQNNQITVIQQQISPC